MKISKNILSIFFPHKCTFCRNLVSYTNNKYICPECEKSLPYIKGYRCDKCGIPIQDGAMPVCFNCRKYNKSFTKAFIPLMYKGTVRKALLSLKFYNKNSYCRSMAYLICQNLIENDLPHFDFITYVPISKDGYYKRGFNQSELIAQKCAEILHLPIMDTLYKHNGAKQSTLSAFERRKNAKKSYYGRNMKLSGTALLIDDIYTTGSTAQACSSLLLKMGCDKVYVAALAQNFKS